MDPSVTHDTHISTLSSFCCSVENSEKKKKKKKKKRQPYRGKKQRVIYVSLSVSAAKQQTKPSTIRRFAFLSQHLPIIFHLDLFLVSTTSAHCFFSSSLSLKPIQFFFICVVLISNYQITSTNYSHRQARVREGEREKRDGDCGWVAREIGSPLLCSFMFGSAACVCNHSTLRPCC